MEFESERYRALMARTGLFMQEVADAAGLSLPGVSRQLTGERRLTPKVAETILQMASERVERAERLYEAARIIGELATIAGDEKRSRHLFETSDLIKELAKAQTAQRPGVHQFKVPPGWEGMDPAKIFYDLSGKPLFGEGTVEAGRAAAATSQGSGERPAASSRTSYLGRAEGPVDGRPAHPRSRRDRPGTTK